MPSIRTRRQQSLLTSREIVLLLAAIFTVLSISCRSESNSSLKHIGGELNRENIRQLTAGPCSEKGIFSYRVGPEEQTNYVRKVWQKIVDANAGFFTGAYSPEKFCVRAEGSDIVNAYAYPDGQILFFSGLLKRATSDAIVAGILAHESAHILMQHSSLRTTLPGVNLPDHPILAASPEWQRVVEGNDPTAVTPELVAARAELEESRRKRDAFIVPIRNFLKPATEELKRIIDSETSKAQSGISRANAEAAKLREKFEEFKASDAWELLTEEQRRQAQSEFNALIYSYEEARAPYQQLLDYIGLEMQKYDEAVDADIVKGLSMIGGPLGKEWRKVNQRYQDAKEQVKRAQAGLYDVVMERGSRILGYDYVRENWMEAEADQVGLELYLNAGFKLDEYPNVFRILLEAFHSKAAVESCDKNFEARKTDPTVPLPRRGRSTHPMECWRRFNTAFTELELHKAEFAPLMNGATRDVVFPGELESVKGAL